MEDTASGLVQSVERALDILDCLGREAKPMRALDIAQAIGLHKNTAHNLIRTLHHRNYLDQVEDSRYILGGQISELAGSCDRWEALRARLFPMLQDLSRQTGDCAFLGVREGFGLRCAALIEGTGAIRVNVAQNWESQLHCTAAGKVLLAWDGRFADEFLSSSRKLEARASQSITSVPDLLRDLEAARQRGYVLAVNESVEHVASIGVPVIGSSGRLLCALAQSFPSFYLQQKMVDAEARAGMLAQVAKKLGAAFEGKGFPNADR